MVFLAGPRQSGKTTISKQLIKNYAGTYYNWDNILDQKKIKESKINPSEDFIVFDEIHKYAKWRNYLKGIYDESL